MIPTGGRPSVELMMAVWSPGFYRVEDYARKVEGLAARTPDGIALEVESTRKNRWRIATKGRAKVVVSYRLTCDRRSVTMNWVAPDLIVLNGAASFVTFAEPDRRRTPHEVRLELPPGCQQSATAMAPAPDGRPDHYRAADYDTLVDSPIVAGKLSIHEFAVEGSRHLLVDAGEAGRWDGALAARNLEKMVRETRRFWGFLPFRALCLPQRVRPGGRRARAQGLDPADRRERGLGTPAGIRAMAIVRQSRIFSRFQREAAAAGRAGPVRLREPAVDQEPVDRRGADDVLRRPDHHPRRAGDARGVPGDAVVAHRAAPELTRPAGAVARGRVAGRLGLRHFGRGP